MDVKAMRHTAYEGGPQDTGFALTVDVQIAWRHALMLTGGSRRPASRDDDVNEEDTNAEVARLFKTFVSDEGFTGYTTIGYTGLEVNSAELKAEQTLGRGSTSSSSAAYDATPRGAEILRLLALQADKDQRAVDVFNAQNPAMRTLFGPLFASNIQPNVTHLLFNSWVKLIPVRWPVLNELWFSMLQLADKVASAGSDLRAPLLGRPVIKSGDTDLYLPPGDKIDAENTLNAQIHAQALVALLSKAFYPGASADPNDAPLFDRVRTLLRQAGLGPRSRPVGTVNATKEARDYKKLLTRVFSKRVSGGDQPSPDVVNRYAWFLILSGFRFPASDQHKRERWYKDGPTLYPTLEGLEDGPGEDVQLDEENVEAHHAAFAAAHPQPVGQMSNAAAEWSRTLPIMSVAAEAARDAATRASAAAPEPAGVDLVDDLMDVEASAAEP